MAKENNIKSFVLRVDAATMEALEQWAADEFRSINGQLQWIIADALRRSGRLKKPRAAGGSTLTARGDTSLVSATVSSGEGALSLPGVVVSAADTVVENVGAVSAQSDNPINNNPDV